jgi:hypothetical protein
VAPFEATYSVNGSLTTIGPLGRAIFRSTANGSVTISNTVQRFSSFQMIRFLIINGIASGAEIDSLRAASLGSKFSSRPVLPTPASYYLSSPGAWDLVMALSTADKSVTGSGTVTLDAGVIFHFNVRGRFRPTDGKSTLVLSAADLATKGSVLRVTLIGNTVVNIRGSITGQTVNANF